MGARGSRRPSLPGPGPLRLLIRLGVGALLAGLVLDLGYHLGSEAPSMAAPCCGVGFFGHIVTLAGMVLATSGLLGVALRTRPRPRTGPEGERT